MKYNGIVISDIHFGAIDSYTLKNELNEVFLKYISELKKIDFIIITGDYFDHKIYLNENISECALGFMDKLVNIAKIHNCPIRIVYGTESHEVDQYKIFSSIYENDTSLNFKIIYTVQEEELLKDLRVLYIPEEYMLSKKEYYANYLNNDNRYNYIFGHGVIQEVMTNASKSINSSKESTRKKVPVFTSKELENITKGQVYFGHYHENTNIQNKIFYVGSYTRWIFGEESPKGFYHITYDTETDKYKQKFIENYLAKRYITYIYGYESDVIKSEENLLEELAKRDKLTESNDGDYIRYEFNIPENHQNPEFIMKILDERYKFNDSVKVKVVNGYVEKKKKINKEKLDSLYQEYPLIFDKNISIDDKLVYFIKKRYNKDIPIDNIKAYLYNTESDE